MATARVWTTKEYELQAAYRQPIEYVPLQSMKHRLLTTYIIWTTGRVLTMGRV